MKTLSELFSERYGFMPVDYIGLNELGEQYAAQFQQPATPALIPFDLQRALAGDKVICRNGQVVTGIHFFADIDNRFSVYGVIDKEVYSWLENGMNDGSQEHSYDLLMAPRTVTKWVNVYKGGIASWHETEQDADLSWQSNSGNYITTTKITWEE